MVKNQEGVKAKLDEIIREDRLFPLSLDQRQRLHQLADNVHAIHELRHIPDFEHCRETQCVMARVIRRGTD